MNRRLPERFSRTKETTRRARELRRSASRAEMRLWPYLRRAALGAPFRRQHPVGPYFVDYYCAPLKLAVEIDGPLHDPVFDARRDAFLRRRGVVVLRFSADDAWEELDGILEIIRLAVAERRP